MPQISRSEPTPAGLKGGDCYATYRYLVPTDSKVKHNNTLPISATASNHISPTVSSKANKEATGKKELSINECPIPSHGYNLAWPAAPGEASRNIAAQVVPHTWPEKFEISTPQKRPSSSANTATLQVPTENWSPLIESSPPREASKNIVDRFVLHAWIDIKAEMPSPQRRPFSSSNTLTLQTPIANWPSLIESAKQSSDDDEPNLISETHHKNVEGFASYAHSVGNSFQALATTAIASATHEVLTPGVHSNDITNKSNMCHDEWIKTFDDTPFYIDDGLSSAQDEMSVVGVRECQEIPVCEEKSFPSQSSYTTSSALGQPDIQRDLLVANSDDTLFFGENMPLLSMDCPIDFGGNSEQQSFTTPKRGRNESIQNSTAFSPCSNATFTPSPVVQWRLENARTPTTPHYQITFDDKSEVNFPTDVTTMCTTSPPSITNYPYSPVTDDLYCSEDLESLSSWSHSSK